MGKGKVKFMIKLDRLLKYDYQLGLFFNSGAWQGERENYIYLCFIKWNISIGWLYCESFDYGEE